MKLIRFSSPWKPLLPGSPIVTGGAASASSRLSRFCVASTAFEDSSRSAPVRHACTPKRSPPNRRTETSPSSVNATKSSITVNPASPDDRLIVFSVPYAR